MNYQESLDFIHSIARFGSKPGLRRVEMLLERMGNPQKQLRFIHVAGTNGKGSTCTMLSTILLRAGYNVGLYISPFVVDFRERIQRNNEMISPEDLAESTTLVKRHWDALDAMGEPPTEFEVVVAVAMDYFVRRKCDIVVLEVGMGGRYDATNVIDAPLVSVITSISIDHTQYLGDTLGQIAVEKCGIIKRGGVCVSYRPQEREAVAVILRRCEEEGNPLFYGSEAGILQADITGSRFRYEGMEYVVPLAGYHQVNNAVTVLETVKALEHQGIFLGYQAVFDGMAATRFPSRLEILSRKPLILLDGAHNLSGAKALADALGLLRPDQQVHVVLGMMADKDVRGVLEALLPRCASVVAVTPNNPRALAADALAALAADYCAAEAAPTLGEAVSRAHARCGEKDVLLLCGSLYLAADLRPLALELSNDV